MKRIGLLSNHWMTYGTLLLLIVAININTIACEACKKQQPKLLKGVTHGAGPDSNWDYIISAVMVLITLFALIASVRCIVKPNEKDRDHIKRIVLND